MSIIRLPAIGQNGAIFDPGLTDQPPDGWNFVRNVRFRDGVAEQVYGTQAFGYAHPTPLYHLAYNADAIDRYWVGAGLSKVYASYDGSGAWGDITRTTGGDYSASSARGWNSSVLNGILLLNNGVDLPQFWAAPSPSTKLANLTNWPSTFRCKSLRAYKNYLIALNVSTTAPVYYPHRVLWSHPADPGTVPASWDTTDVTRDAGSVDLPGDDHVVDGGTLRDSFIVYKERSTHVMRFVGGQYIFAFNQAFTESGILAPNCWTEFDGQHFVMTNSDIIRHDGVSAQSILDGRMRRWLFQNLDADNARMAFVCKQWYFSEIWFCFPEAGASACNLAIVWNYKNNTLSVRDIPDLRHAASGLVGASSLTTWDSDTLPWISDSLSWNANEIAPNLQRLLMCSPTNGANYLADSGYQYAGGFIPASLERTGLTFGAPDRIKTVRSVRPRFRWAGNQVTLQLGTQTDPYEAVTWADPVTFTIGQDYQADSIVSGRYIAFRLASEAYQWQLDGLDFDVVLSGRY